MRMLLAALLGLGVALSATGFAQKLPPPETQRVVGRVDSFDGEALVVRAIEGGGSWTVHLADKAAVFGVSNGTMADIKPCVYIGVGAMPQPDGSQRAIQVTIFADVQRGLGEGFRPWDRIPQSTMTNATVAETVAGVDGPVLTVKYKGGEKTIVVPPDATILAYSVGDKSELKRGAHVAILRARKKLDGSLEADRVNVGRGQVIPR
jgi:hypothetical protein